MAYFRIKKTNTCRDCLKRFKTQDKEETLYNWISMNNVEIFQVKYVRSDFIPCIHTLKNGVVVD